MNRDSYLSPVDDGRLHPISLKLQPYFGYGVRRILDKLFPLCSIITFPMVCARLDVLTQSECNLRGRSTETNPSGEALLSARARFARHLKPGNYMQVLNV